MLQLKNIFCLQLREMLSRLLAKPKNVNRCGRLATVRAGQVLVLVSISNFGEAGALMPRHQRSGSATVELLCLSLPWGPVQRLLNFLKQSSLSNLSQTIPGFCTLELLLEFQP